MEIALDPGGFTGIAIRSNCGAFTRKFLGPDPHHDELYRFLRNFPSTTFITESFEFRQEHRDNLVLISLEYIGVITLAAQHVGSRLIKQTAAQAKVFVDDGKLERAGLLITPRTNKPNKDMNDATRHLLYHRIVTEKDRELTEKVSSR